MVKVPRNDPTPPTRTPTMSDPVLPTLQQTDWDRLSAGQWLALVRAEQRRSWLRGERVPVDGLLRQFPARAADQRLDLIYNEFLLREELGEAPAADEYLARFPDDAAALQRRLALHRGPAVDGIIPPTLPPDATSIPGTLPQSPGELTANAAAAVPGFTILGELGRGGMGVVYQARQVALNRVVALKMILAGGHSTPAERERFAAEARAVAA